MTFVDTPRKIAQHYFDLSNRSDFEGIRKLMSDATTYSSQTTGIYLGVDSILAVQQKFHGRFTSLRWDIDEVTEVKPGIVLFAFRFTGVLPDGQNIESSGHEHVVIHNGLIQHVEIRNSATEK